MIDNLSIAVHDFAWRMLTSLSVNKILLPRYVNRSTNFRGLTLKVEMDLSCLKHLNLVLFTFKWRLMIPAACSRLYSSDLIWAGVFIRSSTSICFQTFFVHAFKIVEDSWKFSMLLLYILWDDWPIFMISGSNQQLQQELEYTLLNPDCHSWWI